MGARVTGDANAAIARAVHPAEASRDGDIAIAVTPEAIRLLSETSAAIALVPEGMDVAHQHLRTLIFIRPSRTTMPAITEVFRHRPDVRPGVHASAVVAPDATIGEEAVIGPLVVIGAGARVGARSVILSQATVGGTSPRQLPITGFAHKAAVVRDALVAAVGTRLNMTAEGGGAAMLDRGHDLELL